MRGEKITGGMRVHRVGEARLRHVWLESRQRRVLQSRAYARNARGAAGRLLLLQHCFHSVNSFVVLILLDSLKKLLTLQES